ncbi:hypothetical protein J6590_026807 [Homalodisca vitripennis]|nr:hypothetical protein J6590_026807 [Homalodisca vitripennis]
MFLYCRWIHCAVLLAVVSVALSKDDNLLITTVKSIGQWFKCVRFKLSGHHTRTPALCLPESSLVSENKTAYSNFLRRPISLSRNTLP